jgi:hypothetical protein
MCIFAKINLAMSAVDFYYLTEFMEKQPSARRSQKELFLLACRRKN